MPRGAPPPYRGSVTVRTVRTRDLPPDELAALRSFLEEAWLDEPEGFSQEDWEHALGGLHFVIEEDGRPVAHAAVVERQIQIGGLALSAGYVEAVATAAERRRRGLASAVMLDVGRYIDRTFELGGLSSGRHAFYGRLGWRVWRGPAFVRLGGELVRTPDDDGSVLVRLTPLSPELDLTAPISCDWRPGDAW